MSKRIGLGLLTAAFATIGAVIAAQAQSSGGGSGSSASGAAGSMGGSLSASPGSQSTMPPSPGAPPNNLSQNPTQNPDLGNASGTLPNTSVLSGSGRRSAGTTGAATEPAPSSACGSPSDPRTGGGLGPQIQIDASVKKQC